VTHITGRRSLGHSRKFLVKATSRGVLRGGSHNGVRCQELGEAMKAEDLLKCPLIEGLDGMRRAELLGLMKDSNIREKVEKCVTEHAQGEACSQPSGVAEKPAVDFQREVHTWNPEQPIWRRSAKE